MNLKERAIEFVKQVETAYFVDRDMDFVIAALDPNIMWIGPGFGAQYQSYDKLVSMLKQEKELQRFPYEIVCEEAAAVPLSDVLCQVYMTMQIQDKEFEAGTQQMKLHSSAVLEEMAEGFRIKSFHVSLIEHPERTHANIMGTFQNESKDLLKQVIDEKNRELEATNEDLKRLTANLPGGIFRCQYDDDLTLLQMSDGFLTMIGYTRKEIEQELHNSFKKLIDPRDYKKTLDDVASQMAKGPAKTLEYRIIRKDGSIIWVLDKGMLIRKDHEIPCFHCILVDITEGKLAQEELRLALEKHQIITNQTNDIIFEWNVAEDHFTFSSNWEKKFGYPPMNKNNTEWITARSHLHPEDGVKIKESLKRIREGHPYEVHDVRIRDSHDKYIWCQARMTTQFDEQGKAISAVGVLIDIDRMKKQSEKLKQKAEQDSLTKLLNKEASQDFIEEVIHQSEDQHAVMIIDIDDFKKVNDTMGHLFGDAFLSEAAVNLKQLFRGSDVVGRIGGDEFIALICNIHSASDAEKKAKEIIHAVHCLSADDAMPFEVSCGIGIALYPDCGTSFHELYHRADLALYKAKNEGKNRYVICDKASLFDTGTLPNVFHKTAISNRIDSDEAEQRSIMENLIEHTFKILYQSIDLESAIQNILKIVGEYFDVSRAYIFENTEDDLYCPNTFEWCNAQIEPEKQNLQHVSYTSDLGGKYLDNFNEDDIFYCRNIDDLPKQQYDILAPQGIRSMLQCAIRDNGQFKGYVGFDECRKNRFWTKEQINALTFIAGMLSIFLIKDRMKHRLEQSSAGLRTILDNQNSWIYVVEPDTLKMLYINQKTRDLVPGVQLGDTCHKAFFNRDTQCEKCPLKGLVNGKCNHTLEVYNSYLNKWSLADASLILWNGKSALLLTCHDISGFHLQENKDR